MGGKESAALRVALFLALLTAVAGAALPPGKCVSTDAETCAGLGQADCASLSIAGCAWDGSACSGTPACALALSPDLCGKAGCLWQVPCTLAFGSECTPGTPAPQCCSQGSCFGGRCCIENGDEFGCTANAQCCSEICDVRNTRKCIACMPEGSGTCTIEGQQAECCLGMTCQGGKCAAPPVCRQEGDICLNAQCCSGLVCDTLNDQSNPACRQCADAGERCNGGLGCCSGQCGADGTCPMPKVEMGMFNDVLPIAALAAFGTLLLVALVYMGGEILQNARMLDWAKTEALQLFTSIVVAAIVVFAVSSFAKAGVGELSSMLGTPMPLIYKGYADQNFYGGAVLYLENVAAACLANVAQLRYNLGAYEIRTSFTEYTCDAECMLSLSSVNVAKFGGETVNLAITNSMLGTATVSHLSALFQYFTLQYILNGVFVLFLPLAIIMRALPFMRQFGGALMGIFVALYLFYPLMIVADAYLAPSLAKGLQGQATLYERAGIGCDRAGMKVFGEYDPASGLESRYLQCVAAKKESDLDKTGTSETEMNRLDSPSGSMNGPGFENSIKVNALIFLTAVFLPGLNFIVVAALARDLTHFLGEEADISRLGQMV